MPPPSVADSVERLVFGGVALTALALAEATPGIELTFPQWRALVVVGTSPDGARVGQVADRIGGGLPATGRLLRRLERRGLVVMGRDPTDRRATRATLTAEGSRIRSAILEYRRRRVEAIVAENLAGLDESDPGAGVLATLGEAFWRLV